MQARTDEQPENPSHRRGVRWRVERGEVFGYLGPNGAGKSTTIDLMVHNLRSTEGTVTVFGTDAHTNPLEVRQRVGILPEGLSPMKEMTGREHIEFAISARNAAEDPATILERVGLLEDSHEWAESKFDFFRRQTSIISLYTVVD